MRYKHVFSTVLWFQSQEVLSPEALNAHDPDLVVATALVFDGDDFVLQNAS